MAAVVSRIAGSGITVDYIEVPQDFELALNQEGRIRAGDNGIFLGRPVTAEQKVLVDFTKKMDSIYGSDGKYIIINNTVIVCQSNATKEDLEKQIPEGYRSIINPLGYWTGGTNVDTGATNRKLGSDLADSVTGGGIHGKDLSKADVSVNIYCWLKAQELKTDIRASCAIGDLFINVEYGDYVRLTPYDEIVETARQYVNSIGGFEKLAEYGLVR